LEFLEATTPKVIKLKSYITNFNLLQVSEEDVKKFERWQKRVAVTLDDRELSETKFIIAVESNHSFYSYAKSILAVFCFML